jgi:hypothetical protein
MTRSIEESPRLRLFASYAYTERKQVANDFGFGEGLVGQAALERKRILVDNAPPDYIRVSSALGEAAPAAIVVVPIMFEGDVKGVIELASFKRFTAIQLAFLDQLLESLGIVVATIEATMRTDELLRESQGLAEELQTQQEELQQTNEELEEKARQLTAQKAEVERKNREVELAKQEVEDKAEQLSLTSRYKSEFLANMSHELRTPLNSLLILSRQLADNTEGNLDDKQTQYAQTINQSGADLLALINEILDLAKIESGTMGVEISPVRFDELQEYVDRSFAHVAAEKGLALTVELSADLPATLETDNMRLKQVLRNLLSNAFKFTDEGGIKLVIRPDEVAAGSTSEAPTIAFSVMDTGIGIPPDKQRLIFEAFQQADGGTARRYGGTGLGLSISREISRLLGGRLEVDSDVGQGSTFTLYLPLRVIASPPLALVAPSRPAGVRPAPATVWTLPSPTVTRAFPDDRSEIQPGDRVLLIVEDDRTFAQTLLDTARERGFRGVVALTGTDALALAAGLKPDAITLDLGLPDMDGWVVLDRLKHDLNTRHIPVHIISGMDEEHRGLAHGAISFLRKPADAEGLLGALDTIAGFIERRVKRLLLVEDDDVQRESIATLIGNKDVTTLGVRSGEEALDLLSRDAFDCMVLDLRLPGMSGLEFITKIKENPRLQRLPIVVYTGADLSRSDETALRRLAETIIVKDVRSPERLLDETALFLHRVQSELPEPKRSMLQRLSLVTPSLAGQKVLVVDDDVRNIFALTAVLEQHQMSVVFAENGQEALDKLQSEDGIDLVLMDIMMPEMDGYEAIRRVRTEPRFERLPIIALTAKAMKGDRDKCIEVGASDYITKPVDPDQLLSLLRVWLHR